METEKTGKIRVHSEMIYLLAIFLLALAVAMLTAAAAQAFLFSLDYRRTENVRFEDDEYFYYVKAIPKRKVHRKKRSRRSERR